MNQRFFILLFGTTFASAVVLLTKSVPLGIPGEWLWNRHELISTAIAAIDRLLLPLLGGTAFYFVATKAQPSGISKFKTGMCYVLLMCSGWLWLNCVQQAAPSGHREAKPYWVLYDPSSAGYFFEAAFKMNSSPEFLANYEARMQEGEVLHVGTHPPGLFLLSKLCLQACESSPTLVSILNSMENNKTRLAFRLIESEAHYAPRLKESQVAALHLLKACSTVAIILTMLPLYVLARMWFDAASTWKLCCLWPTLPCLAIFLPKSDVLFPLTSTTSLALTVLALHGGRRFLFAIPAGIVLWGGLMLSLAHLPVIAVLAAFAALRARSSRGATFRKDATAGFLVLSSIVGCCLVWNRATSCNIFNVWQLNLTNHEGFYTQFPRTWWKWLIANPVELSFAVAVPVMFLASRGVYDSMQALRLQTSTAPQNSNQANFAIATLMVIVALWVSGKNQGEAARLWCFLTPWIILMAGNVLQRTPMKNKWPPILIAQLLIATITVSSVSGFAF